MSGDRDFSESAFWEVNRAMAALRIGSDNTHAHQLVLIISSIADVFRALPETMSIQERNQRAYLYVCGMIDSDTNLEQLRVLTAALQKFGERNQRYKDVWKDSGWKGSLFDMRKKLTRLWRVFWRDEPVAELDLECDDAYDLINFTAFFIRNVKEGNQWGQWG